MDLSALDRLNPQKMHLPQQLLFWLVLAVLVALPVRIHTYNYRPPDDANRHVAKAISGKDWPDILVMDEQYQFLDHNEGWHWILARFHAAGLTADELLLLSTLGLAIGFLITGLLLFRKTPLSWLLALLLAYPIWAPIRLVLGRPLLISSTILLILLHLWNHAEASSARRRWLLTALLIGLAGWVHGAWYLFALLPFCVLLSGRTADAVVCGTAWISGSALAGILNGSPLLFLWGQVRQTWVSVDTVSANRQLVGEFQPTWFFLAVVFMLGLGVFWKCIGKSWGALLQKPACWLVLVGWVLGIINGRFWLDWGLFAFLYLIADSLSEWDGKVEGSSLRIHHHLLSAGFLCAAVFFLYSADKDSLWSNADFLDPLRLEDPSHQGWLPEPGGILYNDSMDIYYYTFFENPQADWRYILGHEPALMPAENLQVYRNLTFYEVRSWHFLRPWVEKMTPKDRMILRRENQPAIPVLEWKNIAYQTWSGRLPRSGEANESSQ